ncbi:hypothetical protein PYW08_011986 [Mythimna loreyi]|uniref:Uncharacterized protein n=1 Tax=Mythimna loreyi TaxID=667449 RepID=A0ACC2QPZ1_9NEOP|nr:hypothetical protein PYW08_011986 [Mythimna loreyi]
MQLMQLIKVLHRLWTEVSYYLAIAWSRRIPQFAQAVDMMDPAQEFEAKILARMKPLNELTARGTSAVQQFYNGANVFLTGGSGYLGKQLIEKLLRATAVSKIFILLRSKKGKSIEQRLIELLQDPVYDLLREQQPNFAQRLVVVSGDVAELRLGLSETDWNTITEQVDVIFHLAATTRFDELLRIATLINIRGTRETLLLGKACKKLKSFIYVSTAYSHACVDRIGKEVLEKFYKSPMSPNTMIEMAETIDERRLNDITANLINNWPNSYTFSKSIAEELVKTVGNELPICVIRPSIVTSAKLEPNPGWVDMSCMYGASGLLVALGLGVMHTLYAGITNIVEFIPVDYVNNATIVAGWETARKRAIGENKTMIYNICSTARNLTTWGKLRAVTEKEARNYPTPLMVGYGFVLNTENPILFWIYSWILHIIPAYIIDGICVMVGKERRFVKLAKKMYKMTKILTFFLRNHWKFDDKNTEVLYHSLSKEDRHIFDFDSKNIEWSEYMLIWLIGLRKYIEKDGLTGTIYARKKQTVLGLITLIVLPLYLYLLFKIACVVLSVFTYFW